MKIATSLLTLAATAGLALLALSNRRLTEDVDTQDEPVEARTDTDAWFV